MSSSPAKRSISPGRIAVIVLVIAVIAGAYVGIEAAVGPDGNSRLIGSGAFLAGAIVFAVIRKLKTGRFGPSKAEQQADFDAFSWTQESLILGIIGVGAAVIGAFTLDPWFLGPLVGVFVIATGLLKTWVERRVGRRFIGR